MPVPRIKHYLSYLWEQGLETTSSPHNEYLEVNLYKGRLQLVAEDAIYSFGDYYLNFRRLFEQFAFERLPAEADVLVLGLGLGSIPEILEKKHGKPYRYVAVEIDPVIIELAAEYSLPKLGSPLEIVEADAVAFTQLDRRDYDLICVDVFQDATVPDHLDTPVFIENVRCRLNPGGAVVFNRLAASAADKAAAREFFETRFLPVFPSGQLVDTGGNYLLVNDGKFLL